MSARTSEAARVRRASRWVGAVLWVVTGGAMATAAATVTAWAIEHGMSPWVAWMVDPLLSVALLTALIGEGVLARHGRRGGAWPAVLRWGTGTATLAANVWGSVVARDAAGVVLHAIAPALVVTVAEAAPRLRRRLAELADDLETEAAARIESGSIESTPTPIAVVSTVVPDPIGPTGWGAPTVAPIGEPIDVRPVEPIESAPAPIRSGPIARAPRVERVRVESTPTAATSGERVGARSIEACRAELAEAIGAGELPATPSAEAIRRRLGVGPTRARALRDELAAATYAPGPGQTALVDVDEPAPIEAAEAGDPIEASTAVEVAGPVELVGVAA